MGAGHIRLYDLFRKELNLSDDKAAAFIKNLPTAITGK